MPIFLLLPFGMRPAATSGLLAWRSDLTRCPTWEVYSLAAPNSRHAKPETCNAPLHQGDNYEIQKDLTPRKTPQAAGRRPRPVSKHLD